MTTGTPRCPPANTDDPRDHANARGSAIGCRCALASERDVSQVPFIRRNWRSSRSRRHRAGRACGWRTWTFHSMAQQSDEATPARDESESTFLCLFGTRSAAGSRRGSSPAKDLAVDRKSARATRKGKWLSGIVRQLLSRRGSTRPNAFDAKSRSARTNLSLARQCVSRRELSQAPY